MGALLLHNEVSFLPKYVIDITYLPKGVGIKRFSVFVPQQIFNFFLCLFYILNYLYYL